MKPEPKAPRLPRQKAPKVVLTPEQIAERETARKEEALRLEQYESNLEKMSHHQLRGELRRTIKREYAGKPPQPQAGLTIGLASILLTVLETSKSLDNSLRANQKNPKGRLHAYPL